MGDLVQAAENFNKMATSGSSLKNDALLMSNEMAGGILAAPQCLQIMVELCKISAEGRDFPLTDEAPGLDYKSVKEKYNALQTPTSMRACLVQVTSEAYEAFRVAHKAMYEVNILASSVKGILASGLEVLMIGSDQEVKDLFPHTLRDIKSVADKCQAKSQNVVVSFDSVDKVIHQLQLAGIDKELATVTEKALVDGLKKEAETIKMQAEEEKKRMDEELENLRKKEEKAQKEMDKAFDKMPTAGQLAGLAICDGLANMLSTLDLTTVANTAIAASNPAAGASQVASQVMNQSIQQSTNAVAQQPVAQQPVAQQAVGFVAEGAANLQSANDDLVKVMKKVKNMYWIGGFFDKTRNTINKKNLINGVEGQTISFASDRLKKYGLEIDVAAKAGASPEMAKMLKDAIGTIEEAVDFAESSCEGAADQVIAGMDNAQDRVNSLLSNIQLVANNGKAFTKPSPLDEQLKQQQSQKSGGGSAAAAVEVASVRLAQAQTQLDNQQKRVDQQFRDITEKNKEILNQVVELQKLDARELTLGDIIKTLKCGIDALARMKQRWRQLKQFFDEIASNIETAMNPKLYALQNRGDELIRNRNGIVTRKIVYQMAYEASTQAYLASEQSGAYHAISEQYLMPLVIQIGGLIGSQDVTNKAAKLRQECVNANNKVEELLTEKMNEHAQSRQARMQELTETFNKCIPLTDETAKAKEDAKVIAKFSKTISPQAASYESYDDLA